MGMANPPPFAICRRRFFIRKFYQGGIYMTEKRTCKERAVQAYWSVVGIAGALILSLQPVLADDIGKPTNDFEKG